MVLETPEETRLQSAAILSRRPQSGREPRSLQRKNKDGSGGKSGEENGNKERDTEKVGGQSTAKRETEKKRETIVEPPRARAVESGAKGEKREEKGK